jgi:hypothetical protein
MKRSFLVAAQVARMLPESFTESVRSQRSYHFLQDYFEMSFLELTAFPSAATSSSGSSWQSQQHYDDFAETVRHVGIRLSGTTDMIAEALLQARVVNVITTPHNYA